jgi:hypothetical protein
MSVAVTRLDMSPLELRRAAASLDDATLLRQVPALAMVLECASRTGSSTTTSRSPMPVPTHGTRASLSRNASDQSPGDPGLRRSNMSAVCIIARPTHAPSSWPRDSAAGRTDAVRQHGGRRACVARETGARRQSRDAAPGGRRDVAPGAPHALLPARSSALSVLPSAPARGREDCRENHRPPGRAAARLGGQAPCDSTAAGGHA